jgi:hypothetical protein
MYNQSFVRRRISEIKLKITDTTLDLSRKAKLGNKQSARAMVESNGSVWEVLTELKKKRKEKRSPP